MICTFGNIFTLGLSLPASAKVDFVLRLFDDEVSAMLEKITSHSFEAVDLLAKTKI